VPFASLEQGLVALPAIAANVWVEFEGGNLDHPVWTGCFWEAGQIPVMPALSPEMPDAVRVLRSRFSTLIFNDTPGEGGITLSVIDPAVEVPVTLTMNSVGVTVEVGELSLVMNPEQGITLRAGETSAVLSPETGVSVTAPEAAVKAESVTITGAVAVNGPTDIDGTLNVTGVTSIEAEASVTGDLSVEGLVTSEGGVTITGALSVEGDVNVDGAAEVVGASSFTGDVTITGATTMIGAVEVAGEVASTLFLGPIEPPPFP
jgi:cytoskeletal protein CcmA (bactofilin family)